MKDRSNDWTEQAQRLYEYAKARPGQDLSAPECNAAAAGAAGHYVASFTKRRSEVHRRALREGCMFLKTLDYFEGGQRRTFYRWTDVATVEADAL